MKALGLFWLLLFWLLLFWLLWLLWLGLIWLPEANSISGIAAKHSIQLHSKISKHYLEFVTPQLKVIEEQAPPLAQLSNQQRLILHITNRFGKQTFTRAKYKF